MNKQPEKQSSETMTLLPCPFCGNEEIACCKDGVAYPWCCYCKECGVCFEAKDRKSVEKKWNTRAERREREGYRLPSEWKLETGEADGEKWISLRTGNNFIRYWPTDGMFYWFLSELLIAAAHDGESI